MFRTLASAAIDVAQSTLSVTSQALSAPRFGNWPKGVSKNNSRVLSCSGSVRKVIFASTNHRFLGLRSENGRLATLRTGPQIKLGGEEWPNSFYAVSKTFGESLLRLYSAVQGHYDGIAVRIGWIQFDDPAKAPLPLSWDTPAHREYLRAVWLSKRDAHGYFQVLQPVPMTCPTPSNSHPCIPRSTMRPIPFPFPTGGGDSAGPGTPTTPPPPPRGLRPTVSWGGSWRPEPRGRPPPCHSPSRTPSPAHSRTAPQTCCSTGIYRKCCMNILHRVGHPVSQKTAPPVFPSSVFPRLALATLCLFGRGCNATGRPSPCSLFRAGSGKRDLRAPSLDLQWTVGPASGRTVFVFRGKPALNAATETHPMSTH